MSKTPSIPVSSGQITDRDVAIYLAGFANSATQMLARSGSEWEAALKEGSRIADRITQEPKHLDEIRNTIATLLTTVPAEWGMLRPHKR